MRLILDRSRRSAFGGPFTIGDGRIIDAIGVSAVASDHDEQVAKAGLEGLK
jgi:uncharacterized protein GlcG (DUF336 family)